MSEPTGSGDARSRLVATPFVRSFIGRARPGDCFDADHARRSSAWASWAIGKLTEVSTGVRAYPALLLDGRFYDPKGQLSRAVCPHLEIPARVVDRPDAEFPDRLALAGNGVCFPWWVYSEVTAVRRALFNTLPGPVGELAETLANCRPALQTGLELLLASVAPQWSTITNLLVTSPDGLAGDATGDFSTDEVAAYFPQGAELNLVVRYDPKLREANGQWAPRRVGVWQIVGRTDGGDRFSIGVLTPRLTANSFLHDPLFAPQRESAAALLVRALLVRRLSATYLRAGAAGEYQVGATLPEATARALPGAHLRAIVARHGHKMPQASAKAAVGFLQDHPDAEAAWQALSRWASSGHLLTVTQESYVAAHRNAMRFLRRAEDPERDDIDMLLPIAWTDDGKVVRVTYRSANSPDA